MTRFLFAVVLLGLAVWLTGAAHAQYRPPPGSKGLPQVVEAKAPTPNPAFGGGIPIYGLLPEGKRRHFPRHPSWPYANPYYAPWPWHQPWNYPYVSPWYYPMPSPGWPYNGPLR